MEDTIDERTLDGRQHLKEQPLMEKDLRWNNYNKNPNLYIIMQSNKEPKTKLLNCSLILKNKFLLIVVRTPTPFTVFQKRFPQLSKTPPVIEMHWIQFLLTSEDTLWPDSSKIMCILYSWILLSNEWSSQFTETEFKLLRTFISNLTFFRGGGSICCKEGLFLCAFRECVKNTCGGISLSFSQRPPNPALQPRLKICQKYMNPFKKNSNQDQLIFVENIWNSFKISTRPLA